MTDLAERFRREGLADAAVILVARRIHPGMDLDDWGHHFDLEHRDLVAAVGRFKGRARGLHLVQPEPDKPLRRNAGRPMLTFDERRRRDLQIRQMRARGEKLEAIAEAMDLTVSRVQQILRQPTREMRSVGGSTA